jgi:DNA-binding transcriptional LysR family regulator
MDVIASLTREGVGISLLPVKRYMPDIESGHLRLLRTKPAGPSVDFFAIYRASTSTNIPTRIAELARDASTFDFQNGQDLTS